MNRRRPALDVLSQTSVRNRLVTCRLSGFGGANTILSAVGPAPEIGPGACGPPLWCTRGGRTLDSVATRLAREHI